jgi:hypothetical protein
LLDSVAHDDGLHIALSPPPTVEALKTLGSTQRRDRRFAAAARTFVQIADLQPNDWLAQYNAGAVCLEANLLAESSERLARATALHADLACLKLYAHVLALRGQMQAARGAYERALALAPRDFDAHWGLFEVTQLLEDNAAALHHQRLALQERSLLTIPARRTPPRTTILELCIAGTFQANIPLDFILDVERTTVHKLYLGEHPIPELPPYDIVFNTIAEASNATQALEAARAFMSATDRPVLNDPRLVMRTSRTAIAECFAGSSSVAVAPTTQVTRGGLLERQLAYPVLIRPVDSHAGNDLAKIDDDDDLRRYVAGLPQFDDFYVATFIDYRNADGYFRKYRIVFVDGVPYPVHLAISPRWMIHYYNAPMAENAWMRDEEHAFMRDMDAVFDGVRAAGLREIARALPLDYFGIDCSIAPDGRVLLFEASTAMIVHLRDPVDLYPYKAQYVPRVVHALERLFDARLGRAATA